MKISYYLGPHDRHFCMCVRMSYKGPKGRWFMREYLWEDRAPRNWVADKILREKKQFWNRIRKGQ